MSNTLYRHSVWIDVFGALLFGAVLLGGVGYLLYHAQSSTSGLIDGAEWERPLPSAVRGQRPGAPSSRSLRRRVPRSSSNPLFSSRLERPSSREAVPFSKSWRSEATPSLTEPSSSGAGGHGGSGGSASAGSGPVVGSARSSGRENWYGGGAEASGRTDGGQWRSEARRLAGRAQALSNQLGQMAREPGGEQRGEASSRGISGESTTSATAPSDDRDAPSPPTVPIDDHVHWLAIAGVLWGGWRLWGGG